MDLSGFVYVECILHSNVFVQCSYNSLTGVVVPNLLNPYVSVGGNVTYVLVTLILCRSGVHCH